MNESSIKNTASNLLSNREMIEYIKEQFKPGCLIRFVVSRRKVYKVDLQNRARIQAKLFMDDILVLIEAPYISSYSVDEGPVYFCIKALHKGNVIEFDMYSSTLYAYFEKVSE